MLRPPFSQSDRTRNDSNAPFRFASVARYVGVFPMKKNSQTSQSVYGAKLSTEKILQNGEEKFLGERN